MLGQPPIWTVILNRVAEQRDFMKNRSIKEELKLGLALGSKFDTEQESVVPVVEEIGAPADNDTFISHTEIDVAMEQSLNTTMQSLRIRNEMNNLSLNIDDENEDKD